VVDTCPPRASNIWSPNLRGHRSPSTPPASDTWTLASWRGQSVTYSCRGPFKSGATGTLSNTATASATDASTVTATDTDTLSPKATLAITKTDNDGGSSVSNTVGTAVPGNSITYTIVASNSGPSTATGASVTDPLALNPAISSDTWTATATGGATGYSATGIGEHQRLAHHPVGGLGHLHGDGRHQVLGHRDPVQHGHGRRRRRLHGDGHRHRHPQPEGHLTITKTDGVTSVVAGTADTYTIVVSNTGP
jgi:uncharacterized repeat protein (TIGR01451 family)